MRLRLAAALTVLLVTAPAGALAARITGTSRSDRLVGTPGPDVIEGGGGNDTILGLGGNDLLVGGLGRDRIFGGSGNDSISVNGDAARDTVSCGTGHDVVDGDPGDSVARDCEVVSRQLSTDTLVGGGGQHATEVEPDSFAFGRTIVAVFQVGRVKDGGATAIGVATSLDGGLRWRSGLLPGVTSLSPLPGQDPRASDPTIAFDAEHQVWLATSLGIASGRFELLVSRSPDGIAWSPPLAARQAGAGSLDKEWLACDNWVSSPNRGRCYLSYLDTSTGIIVTQTTTDGGLSWGPPVQTAGPPAPGFGANGAQPLPRPDGSLVVVYETTPGAEYADTGAAAQSPSFSGHVLAAESTDGGASFGPSVRVATLSWAPAAGLRAPPLPSAGVAADGRLFVAWEDCGLSVGCASDRIVLSSSADGQTWSAPSAIGPPTAGSNQFVPGLGVDPLTSGPSQRLAVAYYSMPLGCAANPACPGVDVWLTTTANGGTSWTRPQRLDAQTMPLRWLAQAGGRFLGDYISVSYAGGNAVPVYSLAVQPWGGRLREAIMALQP